MKDLTKKRKKTIIIAAIALLIVIVAVIILSKVFSSGSDASNAPVRTTSISLSKMNLTSSISATGTLESADLKTVSADLSNVTIKSVKVSEGDSVTKGQTLVTFDESDLNSNYRHLC